jgi:dephospho-CoA kinase
MTRSLPWVLLLLALSTAARAEPKNVVGLLAMPGAGKTTIATAIAAEVDATRVFSTGSVIDRTVRERGEYNIESVKQVRAEFAAQPGRATELIAAEVKQSHAKLAVVEGMRTVADVLAFRKAFPEAKLVAIDVGAKRRYSRMLVRARPGEDSLKVLKERDAAERGMGLGEAMQMADVHIRPGDGPAATQRAAKRVLAQVRRGRN